MSINEKLFLAASVLIITVAAIDIITFTIALRIAFNSGRIGEWTQIKRRLWIGSGIYLLYRFSGDGVIKRAIHWFIWKRRCAWCGRRTGGNPLSYKVSHGICPMCLVMFEDASGKRKQSDRSKKLGVKHEPPYED